MPSNIQETDIERYRTTSYTQKYGNSLPPTSLPLVGSSTTAPLDLILIGFGPASLAIAIAIQESLPSQTKPSTLFLERQPAFAWHAGMQLPSTKMQISFLKDLATPRNPQSHFTFINYLHAKGRLHDFINLGTFLPSRKEYEDYLRWCAGHFEADGQVKYGSEVVEVSPVQSRPNEKVRSFKVVSKDIRTGELTTRIARRVVIAVGGKPHLPIAFPAQHQAVIHSSQYTQRIASALPSPSAKYNIAVVGNGQSAAEIFNDLPSKYPHAKITLYIKGSALRPSDDSPFVNEVFNPDRVDQIYNQADDERERGIMDDRATNYGVVRENLLEHLYERIYMQKLDTPNERDWRVQIKPNRQVISTSELPDGRLGLKITKVRDDGLSTGEEEVDVDAVFIATGYIRNAHEGMLAKSRHLLPAPSQKEGTKVPVNRDYSVAFEKGSVAEGAGVWLQGCNERTHGLSDTLLSILAVRAGEMVDSMFRPAAVEQKVRAKL